MKHSSRDGHVTTPSNGWCSFVREIITGACVTCAGDYITYSLLFKKKRKHFNIGNPNTNTENELTRPYQRLSYFSDPVRFPTSSGLSRTHEIFNNNHSDNNDQNAPSDCVFLLFLKKEHFCLQKAEIKNENVDCEVYKKPESTHQCGLT